MRYAIIESGGKQYRVVEGEVLEVDRLPADQGAEIDLGRVLLMADDTDFMVGTPTLSGVEIKATVVEHVLGRKQTHFRYSPKKRIRVRGGHRQQYTRLKIEFIGRKGEARKTERPQAASSAVSASDQERAKPEQVPATKETPRKATPKKATGMRPTAGGKSTGKKARK